MGSPSRRILLGVAVRPLVHDLQRLLSEREQSSGRVQGDLVLRGGGQLRLAATRAARLRILLAQDLSAFANRAAIREDS